jgi:uncharacterized protein (DUF1697 family)
MPTHVALLRGINVGGRNRVAMADLRETVASLGHRDVATYIQSGNVVFTAATGDASAALAGPLERAIERRLGVAARVVVLSREELAAASRANPYGDETNLKALHAVFLSEAPDRKLRETVAAAVEQAAAKGERGDARIAGRTLYLHTPDGYGRSDLAARVMRAATAGTARNWATVTKLLAMLHD